MAGQRQLAVTMDVGPAVHQRAGLSRYTERLAAHLLAEQGDRVALNLFYNAHSGHELPVALRTTTARTVEQGQLGWRMSVLLSQVVQDRRLEHRLPPGDLYHAPEHLLPYMRRATVLTVHDLIFLRYPQHHTWRNRLFLRLAMPRFVRAADAIIAVSRQTQRDLLDCYGASPAKIHVVYQGIDPAFTPAPPAEVARIRQQYNAGGAAVRPYLLMVGTLEPRKNHAAALRLLARLRALGYPHRLLIVGGEGWLFEPVRKMVQRLGLAADVAFAGFVPLVDLVALYSGAAVVLMPSLYEGFGFPVLEAMACGAPVVCSNVSSLPEVAGDAALLAEPNDDDALVAAVSRILTEPGLRLALVERGLRQAARFQWSYCAAQTAELYAATVLRTQD